MPDRILELVDVHAYYGLAHVLNGVSLSVYQREAVALLGRNGEGKTTTIKTVLGLVPPRGGEVRFENRILRGIPVHEIGRRGISVVPEGRRIFPGLSVIDHLRVPASQTRLDWKKQFFRVSRIFPELEQKKNDLAGTLSGGQQQMLAIARAMMTSPKLLLLDEPMEGLAPKAVKRVIEALQAIRHEDVSLLLASTNCERALRVADRAYIIEKGEIRVGATKQELATNREVQQRYLGVRG